MTFRQRLKRRALSEFVRFILLIYPVLFSVLWALALPWFCLDPWERSNHIRTIREAYSAQSWKRWWQELTKGTLDLK